MHILKNPPLIYIFSIANMVKKDKIHEPSVENQSEKKKKKNSPCILNACKISNSTRINNYLTYKELI